MTDIRATLSRIYYENNGNAAPSPHVKGTPPLDKGLEMNFHDTDLDREPTRAEAEAALALLRRWAVDVTPEEVSTLDPLVSRLIPGQEVSNYPALARAYPDANMSRIMRTFYKHAEETFSFEVIERALDAYKSDLESFDARIQMRFSFPMKVDSLRSGLSGYQYYDIALELIEADGVRRKIIHLDYVYSSTCPCSLELSEHARQFRGQLATPHSQRSVARMSILVEDDQPILWFEDVIDMARHAVPTETQVMVKREDEQAFAELNAANPIFVEDAARLFCEQLLKDARVGDFRVVASHQESLHSHDAVSILTEGDTFAAASIDPRMFQTLFHTG